MQKLTRKSKRSFNFNIEILGEHFAKEIFRFWGRFWINALNEETVLQSYSEIARIRGLDKTPEDGKALLEFKENWFLIIDNADDASTDLHRYLPPGDHGSILVTSRNPYHRIYASEDMFYRMDHMDIDDSINLLIKLSRVCPSDQNKGEAKELVQKLRQLPLVISQAGAAINLNNFSIRSYSQAWDRNKKEILASHPTQGADSYGLSVFATWMTSMKMMKYQDADLATAAQEILKICTQYHHENIPRVLLDSLAPERPTNSAGIFDTASRLFWSTRLSSLFYGTNLSPNTDHQQNWRRFNDALSALASYSLVTIEENGFSIHSLVQLWAGDELDPGGPLTKQWPRKAALTALEKCISTGDTVEDHMRRRQLYPHVRAFLEFKSDDDALNIALTADTSTKFAQTAFDAGNFNMAITLYQKGLELLQPTFWFNKASEKYLETLDALVLTQERNGLYREAMKNARQVVKARKRLLGDHHVATWRALAKQALAHHGLGEYRDAAAINQGLLEKLYAPDTEVQDVPFMTDLMNNQADVLFHEGKYSEAAILRREVLRSRENTLGSEHPETLETMESLALVLQKQDHWKEAHQYASLAYEGRKKSLGEIQPDTLSSLSVLGDISYHQGNYAAAAETQAKVLDSRILILGHQHPDTTTTFNNLARAQLAMGDYKEAEENLRTALGGYKKQLGEDHPFLLVPQLNLAVCFRHQEKYEQAEDLCHKLLGEFKRRGESNHPNALTCKSNLAVVYFEQKPRKLAEAEDLQRSVLQAREADPDMAQSAETYRSMQALAYTISKSPSRYAEAEELMTTAVDGLKDTLGAESRDTLEAACQRAHVLRRLEWLEASCILFQRCCSIFTKLGIMDHWCFRRLGEVQKSMQKRGLSVPIEFVAGVTVQDDPSLYGPASGVKRRRMSEPDDGQREAKMAKVEEPLKS